MTFISGKFKIVCGSYEDFLILRKKYFPQVPLRLWKATGE